MPPLLLSRLLIPMRGAQPHHQASTPRRPSVPNQRLTLPLAVRRCGRYIPVPPATASWCHRSIWFLWGTPSVEGMGRPRCYTFIPCYLVSGGACILLCSTACPTSFLCFGHLLLPLYPMGIFVCYMRCVVSRCPRARPCLLSCLVFPALETQWPILWHTNHINEDKD